MTKLELQLKNKIMRRIYATWLLKRVLSASFLRAILMLIVVFQFAREVSVMEVFRNVPSESLYSGLNYFSSAFSHTELSVQLYLLIIFSIAIWFLAENLASKITFLKMNGSKI